MPIKALQQAGIQSYPMEDNVNSPQQTSLIKSSKIKALRESGIKTYPMDETGGEGYSSFAHGAASTAKSLVAGLGGGLIDTATATYNIPAALHNASQELNKDNPSEYDIDFATGAHIPKSANEGGQLPLIPSATEAIDQGIDKATGGYTETPEDWKAFQQGVKTVWSGKSP